MPDSRDLAGLVEHAIPLETGVTLQAVERPGDGTPVLFLHGIWDDWRYWQPLLGSGPLEERPVWMVDLRGHGGSDKPETGYAWGDYAADITALLDQLAFGRVILGGHSLGAVVGLLVAAECPERIHAMVLEDPPIPLRDDPASAFAGLLEMKQQSLAAIIDDFSVWRPDLSTEQAEAAAHRLKNTADGVFRDLIDGASSRPDVPRSNVPIPAPVLVIRAGVVEQRAFGVDGEGLLSSVISNLRVETVEGSTHTVLRDQPEPYRAILTEFLNAGDVT